MRTTQQRCRDPSWHARIGTRVPEPECSGPFDPRVTTGGPIYKLKKGRHLRRPTRPSIRPSASRASSAPARPQTFFCLRFAGSQPIQWLSERPSFAPSYPPLPLVCYACPLPSDTCPLPTLVWSDSTFRFEKTRRIPNVTAPGHNKQLLIQVYVCLRQPSEP